MAYPVYESSGNIADGADFSVDVPYPATVNDKDILIACLLDADNDTFTVPADWALILEDGSNSNCSTAWMWLRADGTELGTVTFASQLNAGAGVYGVMHRFSGCIETDVPPFEDSDQTLVIQDTTYTRPAVTTSAAERLGVCAVNIEDNMSPSPCAGWTERDEQSSTLGGDCTLQIQDKQIAAATTETSQTAAVGGDDYHGVVVFALLPVPAAGNDQMVGSAQATFSTLATLRGKGVLAGASDIAFTDAAVFRGKGVLVGESNSVFSNSAVLRGTGKLVGESNAVFTNAAILRGAGALVGQSDIAFTNQAVLRGKGVLVGAANIVFSTLATIRDAAGAGAMEALAAITFTTNAVLRGVGKLVGSSNIAVTDSAVLRGSGKLIGEANAVFSTGGVLHGSGLLQGVSNIVFSTLANIKDANGKAKNKMKDFFSYYY